MLPTFSCFFFLFLPFLMQLWEIRRKALLLNRQQCLVVHGSLSQGKQWIVMDALCSYQVMHRMRGNIFWVNCGKCQTSRSNDESEMVLQQLERLYIKSEPHHAIHPPRSSYSGIKPKALNYTETLKRIFEKGDLSDCLIVLIDVQDYETVRAFDLNCRTIITTRDKGVSNTVDIDRLLSRLFQRHL